MAKWIKSLLQPSLEDVKLAENIKKLYKTHDVTVVRSLRGWSVKVERKTK